MAGNADPSTDDVPVQQVGESAEAYQRRVDAWRASQVGKNDSNSMQDPRKPISGQDDMWDNASQDFLKTGSTGQNDQHSVLFGAINGINQAAGGEGNFLDQGLDGFSDTLWGNQEKPGLIGGARRVGAIYNPNGNAANIPGFGAMMGAGQQNYSDAYNRNAATQNANAQSSLIQQLQAAARGQGPSAAQGLLQQATDRNNAMAAGQMASVRGGGAAGAGYAAANAAAMQNQQAASDSAILRAQEQNTAIGQLGNVVGQARGQDTEFQARRDEAIQKYLGMDMSLAQAQQQANFDMEELRTNRSLQQEKLANDAYNGGDGGGGTLGSIIGMISDETLKTNIEDGDKYVNDFLDKLSAHKYDYKSPEKHGEGAHVSVMAQELEQSELGSEFVFETEDGKAVDYGKGFGVMLAAQATLNKRLKKLEEREAGLTGES